MDRKKSLEKILANVCDEYIYNRDEMRRILRSSGIPMHLMGAAVLTALSKKADEEKILAAERLLQEREPEDSPIRGTIKSVTTVHMMIADDIESYYKDLRRTHDLIQVNRGEDDERYYMAAMMMSEKISQMQEILFLVDRTGLIHESMGRSFLSLEDKSAYVTAAFLAASGVANVRAFLEDTERCRTCLEDAEVLSNVPDEMCMLMAAPVGDIKAKCDKALAIVEAFREKGMDFEMDEELCMLPFLAALDLDADTIADLVIQADEFCKIHSGFTEGEGIVLRHVYAAMFVTMSFSRKYGVKKLKDAIDRDVNTLKRMVLMQSQSVMHIQMKYVDREDLHI